MGDKSRQDERRGPSRQGSSRQGGTRPDSKGLVTGRQPVIEAMQSGRLLDKILLQRNTAGDS
ncbi:MAG TPA: hypothetical protein VNU72_01055, partial [Puia sp.]|nr:hypothetical protein [Puia sp.]